MAQHDGSRGRLTRRHFLGGVAATAAGALLAACGASDETLRSSGTAARATAAPATAPPASGAVTGGAPTIAAASSVASGTAAGAPSAGGACTLNPAPEKAVTFNYLGNKFPIIEYYGEQLKTCEGNKNVKVNLDWLPANERDQKANLVLSSGDTSYDIIQATGRNIYEWSQKGWLMPLDDLIAKYKEQYNFTDIPAATWDIATVNGKVWSVPIDLNAQVFFYRKDIWDKYSLKPPVTWDEAIDQFKMLKEKKDTTSAYCATYAKGSDITGEFARHLRAAGGQWFNGTTPTFNDAKGVAAVTKMKSLLPYMPADVLTYNNDKVMVALQQGEAASASVYITRSAQMDDPAQSKVVGKIEFASDPSYTPTGPVGTVIGGDHYVIPAKTKNDPDLIFRVIAEVTKAASMKGGAGIAWMPRASVGQDPEIVKKSRYLPAVQEAIKRGAGGDPKVPFYSLAVGAIGSSIPAALTGSASIEDALNQAAKDFEMQAKEKGFIK